MDKVKQGKANRRRGAEFERQTRRELITKGFITDKWTNNIDLETEEIIQAKSNRFNSRSCGFPDFMAFYPQKKNSYSIIFVECKINGTLDKTEKKKINILIKKGFPCWIAYKGERMKDVLLKKCHTFKFNKPKKR